MVTLASSSALAAAAVDALDRRHVGVVATVTDLDVGLAGQDAVGRVGADPDRLAAPPGTGQQRLQPGVGVDLDRLAASWSTRPRTGIPTRSGRRSRGGAAGTGPGGRSPGRRRRRPRADRRSASRRRSRRAGTRSGRGSAPRLSSTVASGFDAARWWPAAARDRGARARRRSAAGTRRPPRDSRGRAARPRSPGAARPAALVLDAGAHVDGQVTVGPRDLELHHLGAEVVGVAVQPDLRGEAHAELVAALAAVAVGLDAQRVEVVDDIGVVLVLRQVADGEVHLRA